MRQIAIFVLAAALAIASVSAECNKCQPNGVACISKNQFQICTNNLPLTSQNFTCPKAGDVCTNSAIICFQEDGFDLGCGDVKACDVCGGVGSYSCSSRSSYKICIGSTPLGNDVLCPTGQLCQPDLAAAGIYPCGLVCTTDDIADTLCDRDPPGGATTPTTTPPPETTPTATTPTTTPTGTTPTATTVPMSQAVNTACAVQAVTGRFPNPFDTGCHTYLYCYAVANGWAGTVGTCPDNLYFDPTARTCQQARPAVCGTSTTPIPSTPTTPAGATTPTTTGPATTPTTVVTTPTTPTTTVTTPTTAAPSAADAACRGYATAGRYPNPADSSCYTYFYCYSVATGWAGTLGTCPNRGYFDPTTRLCQVSKPATCA